MSCRVVMTSAIAVSGRQKTCSTSRRETSSGTKAKSWPDFRLVDFAALTDRAEVASLGSGLSRFAGESGTVSPTATRGSSSIQTQSLAMSKLGSMFTTDRGGWIHLEVFFNDIAKQDRWELTVWSQDRVSICQNVSRRNLVDTSNVVCVDDEFEISNTHSQKLADTRRRS